jgi:hypothetical protein
MSSGGVLNLLGLIIGPFCTIIPLMIYRMVKIMQEHRIPGVLFLMLSVSTILIGFAYLYWLSFVMLYQGIGILVVGFGVVGILFCVVRWFRGVGRNPQ